MPQIGSLGTADLQPMAATGLVLIGEQAPARFRGRQGPAPEILAERGIPAQVDVAASLRALLRGSGWMTEQGRRQLGEDHARVQDAVSLQAAPHILGALREELAEAWVNLERETNGSNSNPLVFARRDGEGSEFVMGGNWDAALMGQDIDTLNAQITDMGVLYQEMVLAASCSCARRELTSFGSEWGNFSWATAPNGCTRLSAATSHHCARTATCRPTLSA